MAGGMHEIYSPQAETGVTEDSGAAAKIVYEARHFISEKPYRRPVGTEFHVDANGTGVLVVAHQFDQRFTDDPRTEFVASVYTSEVRVSAAARPPITDPEQLGARVLEFAEQALQGYERLTPGLQEPRQ